MHGTRINLDEITFLYRDFTDQLTPASVVYHVFQFFVCLCIVSDNKLGIRLTVKDIPALHLAKRTVFMLCSIGIIRMYLNT